MNSKKIIILAGATGSGKTALCLQLPKEQYEIVSFDSRQVYKFLCLGTAKPTKEDINKIPHHMIDFLEPNQTINAKDFSVLAEECVLQVWKKNKIPILTVGTFFYLKAFLFGMFVVPEISLEVKEKVQSMSLHEKWKTLQELDEASCQSIHPHDEYRITRALEVTFSGKKWSEASKMREIGFLEKYNPQVLGYYLIRERKQLYERINQRAKQIFANGIEEETQFVLQKFGANCPALETLGYSFVMQYLEGKISKSTAIELFAQSHRKYAKRQITWFKNTDLLIPLSPEQIYSKLCLQEF